MTPKSSDLENQNESGELLNWEDKKRFQRIFTDQAVRSYVHLSFGMGLLALLLPIALLLAGGYEGHFSISYFYHVSDLAQNILVGILWAIGVFLFLFQGLSRWENWILNAAGVAAIMVAMNPMPTEQCAQASGLTLHAASAVFFFVCLAIVAIGFSKGRIQYIIYPPKRRRFKRAYDTAGVLMIAMPAVVVVLHFLGGRECETHWIFWIETLGIAAFSFYWFVKTLEYKLLLRIKKGRKGPTSAT